METAFDAPLYAINGIFLAYVLFLWVIWIMLTPIKKIISLKQKVSLSFIRKVFIVSKESGVDMNWSGLPISGYTHFRFVLTCRNKKTVENINVVFNDYFDIGMHRCVTGNHDDIIMDHAFGSNNVLFKVSPYSKKRRFVYDVFVYWMPDGPNQKLNVGYPVLSQIQWTSIEEVGITSRCLQSFTVGILFLILGSIYYGPYQPKWNHIALYIPTMCILSAFLHELVGNIIYRVKYGHNGD